MTLKGFFVAALAGLSLGMTSCATPLALTEFDTTIPALAGLTPRAVELSGVPVLTQPNASTCGITAVTVAANFLNGETDSVADLIARHQVDTSKGTNQDDLVTWLSGELPDRTVEYHHDKPNDEMLSVVHASLVRGVPVVVFFGSENKFDPPHYDFHASVVYGLDLDAQTVTIANSYGFAESTSLVDFLNRMNFSERSNYPSGQQFALNFGLVSTNMVFVVR